MKTATLAMVLTLLVGFSFQHRHADSPYAGQQDPEIPSLTAEELQGLRNGEGMGLARAAELNHYPGPKHVLELAGELGLSEVQRRQVEEIRRRMLEAAIDLGNRIIEAERLLNRRFAHGHIDASVLEEMTRDIATLRGKLRAAHLRAHLETRAALTDEQTAAYDRLRGYVSAVAVELIDRMARGGGGLDS